MVMKHIFRRHVEKKEKEVAELKRALAEMKRDLELERINTYVDLYLKAQKIRDPENREIAFTLLRPLIQPLIQKKTPPGPH